MNELKVLDHGFVRLLNVAGPTRRTVLSIEEGGPFAGDPRPFDADDRDPANVARMSFGQKDAGRTREQDLQLARYLAEHHHCYHAGMQVLTATGWKYWQDLGKTETFLVPNPSTKQLQRETLEVLKFNYSGELCSFLNERMSYAVTPNHMMWFKNKHQYGKVPFDFAKVRADNMRKWGWFEPLLGYTLPGSDVADTEMIFVGFYLGDGSYCSANRISFHLKKERKIDLLESLIEALDIPHTKVPSGTREGAYIFTLETPRFLKCWVPNMKARSKDKNFYLERLGDMSREELYGLWVGLSKSDGSYRKDRHQVSFGSTSLELLSLFETLSAYLGLDAHYVKNGSSRAENNWNQSHVITAYTKETRTSLESRAEYHGKQAYSGEVFCATTSTGFLAVRGAPDKFGFVCGNSGPFEFIQVYLEMKLPIFVARQLVRHRTASLNEVSARYSCLSSEWYVPELDQVGGRAPYNKQGRGAEPHPDAQWFRNTLQTTCHLSYEYYREALQRNVAPELARLFLHTNHYTQLVWTQNLRNLMHLLSLRLDAHAQWETQQYAQAIEQLLRQHLPTTMALFDEYWR